MPCAPVRAPAGRWAGNAWEGRSVNKVLFTMFLLGGVALAISGMRAAQPNSSGVSLFLSSSPADRALWMLVGGVLLAFVGLAGLWRGSRKIA